MNLKQSRPVQLLIITIGSILIVNLSRDILRLFRSSDRLKEAEQKVAQLKEEQRQLQEKKEFYASDEFVEQEARNKLNMAKPGETVVILPPNVPEVLGRTQPAEALDIPNWQKWWNLFF